MSPLMRGLLCGALVLLLPVMTASASEPAVCADASASTVEANQSVETTSICAQSLCWSDQDCYNACPGAASAACINDVCHYPTGGGGGSGGGGGGGGGGGPICPISLCMDDSQCLCGGRQGYCMNEICYY